MVVLVLRANIFRSRERHRPVR